MRERSLDRCKAQLVQLFDVWRLVWCARLLYLVVLIAPRRLAESERMLDSLRAYFDGEPIRPETIYPAERE